jgi:lipoic acid synthetase
VSALAPEGRKLLRVEARNAESPIERKPEWIKTRATANTEYEDVKRLARKSDLHTVCEEAGCPNIYECWQDREATFLIGGDQCTRRCDFCMIATGKPAGYDREEPQRVAESVRELGLRYATVTGVARDDLPDGACWLFAETARQIHALNPGTGVELLVDDFRGGDAAIEAVCAADPEVFAHNIETVPRIFKQIRPGFRYDRSLRMLARASELGMITKSNLILGMGETSDEIVATMRDLRDHDVDVLTLTQYLRPSRLHHPVDRWVQPQEFIAL